MATGRAPGLGGARDHPDGRARLPVLRVPGLIESLAVANLYSYV